MNESVSRVLIIGAGVAGQELLHGLQSHFSKQYIVNGFIDDDEEKFGKVFNGVKVLGGVGTLPKFIKQFNIGSIFIAIPSAQGSMIRRILNFCQDVKLSFKIVPRTLELVQGKVELHHLRNIQIEDLFGQAIVQKEQSIFSSEFKGKTILVTGAAGSIGSEICKQLIQFEPKLVVACDWWENGLFELAKAKRVCLIAKAPLQYGFLTGKYSAGSQFPKSDHRSRIQLDQRVKFAERAGYLRTVLKTHERSLAQAALRFCLMEGMVTSAIPGMKTVGQVKENIESILTPPLGMDDLERIHRTSHKALPFLFS